MYTVYFRLSLCCWHSRICTRKTFICWEAIMRAVSWTFGTGFSASAGPGSAHYQVTSFGRHSTGHSTVCLWPRSLAASYSAHTVVSVHISDIWVRSTEFGGPPTYPGVASCVTCCGPIRPTVRLGDGTKTSAETFRTCSAPTGCLSSCAGSGYDLWSGPIK